MSEPRGEVPTPVERLREAVPLHGFGWAVLGGSLTALLLGWGLRWWELRLMGLVCLLLLLAGLAFTLGRPRFRVDLAVDADRVEVGEPAGGTLVVTNTGSRRCLPTRLDLPIGNQIASFHLPGIAPGQSRTEEFTVPTARRGVVQVGPARSVQGDPFSLAGRSRLWTSTMTVHVHPRSLRLPGRQAGFVHDMEGQPTSELSTSDLDFHALREYVPGDDLRQVHWRSTARTGTLMVRQFAETRQSRVALALDLEERSYLDEDEFELAVSCAASIGLQSLREGHPVTLVTQQQVLVRPQPRRFLDELAAVAPGEVDDLRSLLRQVGRRVPSASVVHLVTGSVRPVAEVNRDLTLVPAEVRVVAVHARSGGRTQVRTVQRLSNLVVPTLDELPRSMREAMG